jgi:hypothetical protein
MAVVEPMASDRVAAYDGDGAGPAWAGSLQRMILLDLVGRAERASADELATVLETMGAELFEAEMRALFGEA